MHAPASSDDAPAATNDVGFAAAKAAAAGPAAPFSGRRWGREEPGWSPDAIPAHDEPAPGAVAVAPRPARRAYDGDDVSTIKEAVWQPPVVAAPVAAPVAVTPAVAVGRTPPETAPDPAWNAWPSPPPVPPRAPWFEPPPTEHDGGHGGGHGATSQTRREAREAARAAAAAAAGVGAGEVIPGGAGDGLAGFGLDAEAQRAKDKEEELGGKVAGAKLTLTLHP